RTIGECLANCLHVSALSRLERLRTRQAEQLERGIDSRDGPGDCIGEIHVASRHVVEGPVWLHMPQTDALGSSNTGERTNLIGDEIFHVARRGFHLATPEPDEIGKSRMSSNRGSMFARQRDRSAHYAGIAGVE